MRLLGVIVILATSVQAAEKSHAVFGQVTIRDDAGALIEDAGGVLIYLDGVASDTAYPIPAIRPKMASREKKFVPDVLPVLVGTTVDFPNTDPILHNVFSLSKTKSFDLGLYHGGGSHPVTFDKPGVVRVYCNIHEGMNGYVIALENPHFTLTDAQGRYEIPGAPPGTYSVASWYRFGPGKTQTITVGNRVGRQEVNFKMEKGDEVNFELVRTRITYRHRNKWGQPYKKDY